MKEGASPVAQLEQLQAACMGKLLLLVLDDVGSQSVFQTLHVLLREPTLPQVWDSDHEKLLNCLDPASASRLMVTTRIRGTICKAQQRVEWDLPPRGPCLGNSRR